MVKAFTKFLLSLSIFLLSGQGQLPGQLIEEFSFYSTGISVSDFTDAGISLLQPDQTFVSSFNSSGTQKGSCRLEVMELVCEEEIDRSVSKKKEWKGGNENVAIPCSFASWQSCQSTPNHLIPTGLSFPSTSKSYILNQVFRL